MSLMVAPTICRRMFPEMPLWLFQMSLCWNVLTLSATSVCLGVDGYEMVQRSPARENSYLGIEVLTSFVVGVCSYEDCTAPLGFATSALLGVCVLACERKFASYLWKHLKEECYAWWYVFKGGRPKRPLSLPPGTHIPDVFKCPITHELLDDPVLLGANYFSRTALLKWVEARHTNPITNAPCRLDDIHDDNKFAEELYQFSYHATHPISACLTEAEAEPKLIPPVVPVA